MSAFSDQEKQLYAQPPPPPSPHLAGAQFLLPVVNQHDLFLITIIISGVDWVLV